MENLIDCTKQVLDNLQAGHNSESEEKCKSKTRPGRYIFLDRK